MSNPPLQNVAPGAPRFVGITVTGNQVNADGTTTPVVDTTTPLVLTPTNAAVTAVVDPNNNRRVILTSALALGAPGLTGNVKVDTNPPLPVNTACTIPYAATSAPDQRRSDWDGTQGVA